MLTKSLPILSLTIGLSALPMSASAANFSNVLTFGDSLTDSGNVALFTAPNFQPVPFGGLMPSGAYESGRFTNGPVWVENLATNLGLSAAPSLGGGTNFAFGGARTGPSGTTPPTPPSLLDQLAAFGLATGGVAPTDGLYVVWGGNNDVRDAAVIKQGGDDIGATATLTQAVTDIVTIIGGLKNAGAVNILVPNVSNLGVTPEATRGTPGLDTASTAVTLEYNTLLSGALTSFRNDPTFNLIEIDAFAYFSSVFASPGDFGLTNVTDPCVDIASVCSNPSEFFFYDGLHPTAIVHQQFAQFVSTQIPSVPEPTSIIGIGLVTGVGALFTKRKKAKQV
ncbi:MAG: PEP-CTERM sorting domain-containing protein [Crocosphaera sp.]